MKQLVGYLPDTIHRAVFYFIERFTSGDEAILGFNPFDMWRPTTGPLLIPSILWDPQQVPSYSSCMIHNILLVVVCKKQLMLSCNHVEHYVIAMKTPQDLEILVHRAFHHS